MIICSMLSKWIDGSNGMFIQHTEAPQNSFDANDADTMQLDAL